MENWPRAYPSACNCQGRNHKFYKNCLSCGLIFCQQNSKLSSCTFCASSFDSPVVVNDSRGLEKALNLQSRLLAADLNTSSTSIKDEYTDPSSTFLQTKFCPASEISAKKREIEEYKMKLAKEQEEKSTFDLSKMLKF